jgi:hypothetical protein
MAVGALLRFYIFSGAETIRIQFRETQPQRRGPIFLRLWRNYSALNAFKKVAVVSFILILAPKQLLLPRFLGTD